LSGVPHKLGEENKFIKYGHFIPFVVMYPFEIERLLGVTYKTAYRWWRAGRLDAYQLETGTVIVRDPTPKSTTGVALYARVSSADQKNDLERQMERLKDYAAVRGLRNWLWTRISAAPSS
jgi:predicted site-specific integrase-resolvase